jgi:hypothetical protein
MRNGICLIISMLLFASCGSNAFTFNEKEQTFEANSTYFGCIEIKGMNNNDCFTVKRKPNGKKSKIIILTKIPNSYYVVNCLNFDTIKDFRLKINAEYEIINRGTYDAAPNKILIMTDEKGLLRQKK